MAAETDAHLQEINEEIYKRNLELAVVNKTLSLLRKLYQISLLSLDPAQLSEKISETVRGDLNMELVGVFAFDEKKDALLPFKFAESDRLSAVLTKVHLVLHNLKIPSVFKKSLLKKITHDKNPVQTTKLEDIWSGVIDEPKLKTITDESHIKTILLYPLIAQDKIIGVVLFALNRDYETLSVHEQDSIKSLIDVVAVALDKANLYEKLRVANDQLKILDQARSEFITIASHQLRTPPASIKWYLAAIIHGDFGEVPEAIKAQLIKTQTTNNLLIGLIDDLLNVSRIERGKLEFFFQPTDLVAITQVTVDQLIPQAEAKKIKLIFEKPLTPIPTFIADREKVRQVINNLIDNAIKYTQVGEVIVEVGKTDKDFIVKVKDSGRGVTKDQIKGIFEKFDRGKEAAKHSTGLGLGLYVGKVIIEQHNGKLWVESEGEGKGSTFIFTIPIKNKLVETTFDLTKTQKL